SNISADWLADFEAAAERPLPLRMRYAFIHTHKPGLDEGLFRAFDTMAEWMLKAFPFAIPMTSSPARRQRIASRIARAFRAFEVSATTGSLAAGIQLDEACSRPFQQQLALACVALERGRALELPTRLVRAAELSEEVAAHPPQQVVAPKRRPRGERIDEIEAGLWTKRHRVRDRAIQIDDR